MSCPKWHSGFQWGSSHPSPEGKEIHHPQTQPSHAFSFESIDTEFVPVFVKSPGFEKSVSGLPNCVNINVDTVSWCVVKPTKYLFLFPCLTSLSRKGNSRGTFQGNAWEAFQGLRICQSLLRRIPAFLCQDEFLSHFWQPRECWGPPRSSPIITCEPVLPSFVLLDVYIEGNINCLFWGHSSVSGSFSLGVVYTLWTCLSIHLHLRSIGIIPLVFTDLNRNVKYFKIMNATIVFYFCLLHTIHKVFHGNSEWIWKGQWI